MKKSQIKPMFALILAFILLLTLAYAVSTTLESPADNFVDNDGFLDLRASCTPGYDGTTSYNITSAVLYSNVSRIWKANKTLQVMNPVANSTYYFNFTNYINQTAEVEFKWSVECSEQNDTGIKINKAFIENNTLKVEYAKPTVAIISPADGASDSDGYGINVVCTVTPTSGWNITLVSLMTNISGKWRINQTYSPVNPVVDSQVTANFVINKRGNESIEDGTGLLFGCSAAQAKNDLEVGFSSEKSSANRTIHMDICIQGSCDLSTKSWCNNGVWKEDNYCSRCGNLDDTCPVCENNACDRDNERWCGGDKWSVIDYCSNCGDVDASCNETCDTGTCDTKNRKWCNNGVWEDSDYCINCGGEDSSCSFECSINACDTKNKQWCNNGVWTEDDYCSLCGSKDFSCGVTCRRNTCDTTTNKWCDAGSWSSLNYCDHCQDSQCLDTCDINSCDISARKWCDNGVWSNEDYCDKCSNKDSSCLVVCKDDTCDITADKKCVAESWTSVNYCDTCGLKDSDCTVTCAEGECDTKNKRVCKNGEWTDKSYGSLCGIPVSKICKDYGNCTIGSFCSSNKECASELCSGNRCIAKPAEEIKPAEEESKDKDEDGILDEWETEHGLDPLDPLDADLDFDEDGLTNIQEFNYGTNPNKADSDGDGVSDKEEIDEGTDPLDAVSKPGGIGGLLFGTIILIIIFAAGSYAFYYYKDYFIRLKVAEPSFAPEPISPAIYKSKSTPSNKILEEERVHEIVKERRKKKEEKRAKLLETFGKRDENKKPLLSVRKGQKDRLHKAFTQKKKEDVFSKLKLLSKKGKN